MLYVLFVIHTLISVLLIIIVLLQSSKGGGLAAGLGGGGATSLLGTRGTATFLSKATTVLAASFMVSSLLITIIYNSRGVETSRVQELLNSEQSATPAPTMPPIQDNATPRENTPVQAVPVDSSVSQPVN